jgi:signal-transduction protein with cAMP-binding, CBS, and nucleotidyltransferase domain
MRENQIRRVPIVDAEGKLCGVLSTADILQRSDLPSDVMQEAFKTISEPSEHASRPRAQMQRAA